MPPLPHKAYRYRNHGKLSGDESTINNSCIHVAGGELVMNDSAVHYYSERLRSGMHLRGGHARLNNVSLVGVVATPCMGPGGMPSILSCAECEENDPQPLPIPVTSCARSMMGRGYAHAVSSVPDHTSMSAEEVAQRITKQAVDQRYREGFRKPVGMAFQQLGYLERSSTGILIGNNAHADIRGEHILGFDVGVDFLGSGSLDDVQVNGNGFGLHIPAQTPWAEQQKIQISGSRVNGNKVGMVMRSGFNGSLFARRSDVKYNEIQGVYMGQVKPSLQCHLGRDVNVQRNGSRLAASDWITGIFSLWAAHELAVWAHDEIGFDRLILLGSALLVLDHMPAPSPSAVAELKPIFGNEVESYTGQYEADYRPKRMKRNSKWRVNNPNFVLTGAAKKNCVLPARANRFFGGRRFGIFAAR